MAGLATAGARRRLTHPQTRTEVRITRFYFENRFAPERGVMRRSERAEPARDCWLYLYEFSQAGVSFREVHVTADRTYRVVDLATQAGKYPRRPAPKPLEGIPLRASETLGLTRYPIRYRVLVSPFQMPWSRLFDMRGVTMKTTDPRWPELMRWLGQRTIDGFEFSSLYAEPQPGGTWRVYLWSPWTEAAARSQELQALLERARRAETPEKVKTRYLVTAIRSLGDDKYLGKYLKMSDFRETEEKLAEDARLWAEVERSAESLTAYLESPRFAWLKDDARAGDFDANHARLLPIEATANEALMETFAGRKYLLRLYGKEKDFYDHIFDNQKVPRKAWKAAWALIKIPVAFATGDKKNKEVSARVARYARWMSEKLVGVNLLMHFDELKPGESAIVNVHQVEQGRVPRVEKVRFDDAQKQHLKNKTSEHKGLNNLTLFMEFVNVIYYLRSFLDVLNDPRRADERLIEGAKLIGALASAMSGGSGVISALSVDEMTESAFNKAREEAAKHGLDLQQELPKRRMFTPWRVHELQESQARRTILKIVRNKGYKAGLGAIAGAVDLWVGIDQYLEGSKKDDVRLQAGGVVTFGGGFLAVLGSFAAVSFPAFGAVVLVLGAIGGLSGSIIAGLARTDLETWLLFCPWGKRAGSNSQGQERWLPPGVPVLGELYTTTEGAIDALHNIFVDLDIVCEFGGGRAVDEIRVRVTARNVEKSADIQIDLRAETKDGTAIELHAFGPWATARTSSDVNGAKKFEWKYFVTGGRRVRGKVQVSVNGLLHPRQPREFSFDRSQ